MDNREKEIRIGIIGHGFMGHEHETMLSDFNGISVTAICDIDVSQLEDVRAGIAVFTDPDTFMQYESMDVVLIAVNNNRHKEMVCKAAKAGKDIICEKPAAMSVAEFDEMIRVVEECGVKFTVHHQRRYDPDYRTAKEVYDQGTLGDVYTVKSSLYGYNGNMHDWHVYKAEGGGMLFDWGVHLLDQLLWMVKGKIVSVYADVRNIINFEVDDYFKILLKFDSGVMAEVELGTYYLKDTHNWFERHWFIGGSRGSMYADGFRPQGKIVRTTKLLENVGGARTMTAAGPTRSFGNPQEGLIVTEELPQVHTKHRDYFDNYKKAYCGGEAFFIRIPEVRRVLALMEAVSESAKTGQAVAFEQDGE